jgi:hypothetical protein
MAQNVDGFTDHHQSYSHHITSYYHVMAPSMHHNQPIPTIAEEALLATEPTQGSAVRG